jgi:cytochrome c1
MDLVAFRHLGERGAPYGPEVCAANPNLPEGIDCSAPAQNPIIKSLAAEFQVEDGPDEAGDMFMRPGLPQDYFPSPFANVEQARAANGGAYPPDFSLIVKARHHGAAYVYSLLTGYEEAPETVEIPAGSYYNPYYPGDMRSLLKEEYVDEEGNPLPGVEVPYGGVLKMAPPLSDGIVTYEDGSPETVEQYSEDVMAFLHWAA